MLLVFFKSSLRFSLGYIFGCKRCHTGKYLSSRRATFLTSGCIIKHSLSLSGAWAPDAESGSNRDRVWSVRGIRAETERIVWAGCGETLMGNNTALFVLFFVKIHTSLLWFEFEWILVSESLYCCTQVIVSPPLWPEFHCTVSCCHRAQRLLFWNLDKREMIIST